MVSGCLFTLLGGRLRGNFSCALIKSATAQVCVKCSWSLLPVFLLCEGADRYRQRGGRVSGDSLWWAKSLALWSDMRAYTETHMLLITSHNGAEIQSVSVQEMEFIYQNCLDAPAIALIALFCQFRTAKLIVIKWFNCCEHMCNHWGNRSCFTVAFIQKSVQTLTVEVAGRVSEL